MVTALAPHGGCNWKGCRECFPKQPADFFMVGQQSVIPDDGLSQDAVNAMVYVEDGTAWVRLSIYDSAKQHYAIVALPADRWFTLKNGVDELLENGYKLL